MVSTADFYKDKHTLRCPQCGGYIHYKTHRLKDRVTKQYLNKWKCYACMWIGGNPKVMDKKRHVVTPKTIPSEIDYTRFDRNQIIKILDDYTANPYILRKRHLRNVAFIAFTYLTASRVTEVVGERDPLDKKSYIVPPIYYSQVSIKEKFGQDIFCVQDMPVLKRRVKNQPKNRQYLLRSVEIPAAHEEKLVTHIMRYIKLLKPTDEQGNDTILFKFSRVQAWNIAQEIIHYYPHFERHSRLSDLVKIYGLTSLELMHYVGWGSEKMAARYTHLHSDDLLLKMLRQYEMKKNALVGSAPEPVPDTTIAPET